MDPNCHMRLDVKLGLGIFANYSQVVHISYIYIKITLLFLMTFLLS